jgi:hypothetical protein
MAIDKQYSPIPLPPAEVERLAGVAEEAFRRACRDEWPAWLAVVTSLLADPAVLAAAWRAGAEAMQRAVAERLDRHFAGDSEVWDRALDRFMRPGDYARLVHPPAYPGGANVDER